MNAPPSPLRSNGIPIPFDQEHFAPLQDSSRLLDDPDRLQARYREDGYLLLRGVLDRAQVIAMRSAYFSAFDPSYLRAGTRPPTASSQANGPGPPAHGVAGHPAHAFVRTARVHGLRRRSPPRGTWPAASWADRCSRCPAPLSATSTGRPPRASRAHVDYSYLDAGSDQVLTVWIPLGDCPRPVGGLLYLEGTHRMDRSAFDFLRTVTDRPGDSRAISHDLAWVSEQLGRRWLWADYRPATSRCTRPTSFTPRSTPRPMSCGCPPISASSCQGEKADARWLQAWAGDDGN